MAFVLGLRARGIANVDVLRALETIPREVFVPHRHSDLAWRDMALPIACGQTMPTPYVVARLVEALELDGSMRVYEVGAGSGYATAILGSVAGEVRSTERFATLAAQANERLRQLRLERARVEARDGLDTPRETGVFERIVVHARLDNVPRALRALLAPGGFLACGRADGYALMKPANEGWSETAIVPCRLAPPLAGRAAHL